MGFLKSEETQRPRLRDLMLFHNRPPPFIPAYYTVKILFLQLFSSDFDNGYMGLDSISLLDFWENTQVTKSPMRLMPMGTTGYCKNSLSAIIFFRFQKPH